MTMDLQEFPFDPDPGEMKPIEAKRIRKPPVRVPHREITQEEVDVLEQLVKVAPFYLLKYGIMGIEVVEKGVKPGSPVLKLLFKGLKLGLTWAKKKLSVE